MFMDGMTSDHYLPDAPKGHKQCPRQSLGLLGWSLCEVFRGILFPHLLYLIILRSSVTPEKWIKFVSAFPGQIPMIWKTSLSDDLLRALLSIHMSWFSYLIHLFCLKYGAMELKNLSHPHSAMRLFLKCDIFLKLPSTFQPAFIKTVLYARHDF